MIDDSTSDMFFLSSCGSAVISLFSVRRYVEKSGERKQVGERKGHETD